MPTVPLDVEVLTGSAVEPLIPEVARLRLEVFREFPYLYEGSMEYELSYLEAFIHVPESVCVVARADDKVIGISTGAPINREDQAFRGPFQGHGYDLSKIFYYGESVVLPPWRGIGLGHRFMEERENYARSLGRFEFLTFFVVERSPTDPRRPAGYRSPEDFWRRWGFRKHPELSTTFTWKEVGDEIERPKPMVFWLKYL